MIPGTNPMQQYSAAYAQMLGLAGFNSQQAAAGLAGGRNHFTQQQVWLVLRVKSYLSTNYICRPSTRRP
jgi:hypothetical protein